MRKVLSTLLFLLAVGGVDGAVTLNDMSAAIEQLGRYEARFTLSISGSEGAVDGYYIVDGDKFFLSIADQQIYGDGAERCTINHNQREVVLERLPDDGSQPLVVVDPVAAFANLAREFEISDEVSNEYITYLKLTPKSDGGVVDNSSVEIDNVSHLPRRISYQADGEEVSLTISYIDSTDEQVTMSYPSEYEVLDIR